MEFRRSGSRDDRRRRVLIDESCLTPTGDDPDSDSPRQVSEDRRPTTRKGVLYADAALYDRQPALIAPLAARRWTIVVMGLVMACVVASLMALYGWLWVAAPSVWRSLLPSLDLRHPASLSRWVAVCLLGWTAVLSVLVYVVRRHRLDDYRGRYRIWIWLAVLLTLASADTISRLHAGIPAMGQELFARRIAIEWYLLLAAVACIGLALRMCVEMNRSRGSIVCLASSAFAYVCCLTTYAPQWLAPDQPLTAMLQTGLLLMGHTALWLAITVYGRYVFLTSQGIVQEKRLEVKKHQPALDGKAAAQGSPSKQSRQPSRAAPERTPAQSDRRVSETSQPARGAEPSEPGAHDDEAGDDPPAGSKLSKAERRRLRKQRRRQAA